ncbi:TfoX/Sxy family protein, partial [Candidatus Pacebacteria bacterium]|nr:TfoX/Sxy family protein [Candidatus Paceibacterota bacterium]
MHKPIDDFKDYIVEDVLGHIENVTSKRMFGGYSLYLDGDIFGMITSDTDLFFKVDDTNRDRYEAIGSYPFVYSGWKDPKRKPITMPYWHISEDIMEDREAVEELV